MFMAMVPVMSALALVQSNCEAHTSGAPPLEWYWSSSTGKTCGPALANSPQVAPPALPVAAPRRSSKTWPEAKGEPTEMERAPAPPPARVKQTKVVLLPHELLGVTDDIEYTVALPEARSVTTMLASVSGATAWGCTDDGLATLDPWWGPNPPVRGASAAAGRLKATVPVSVATAMAMPETTPRRARRPQDLGNLIQTSPLPPRERFRAAIYCLAQPASPDPRPPILRAPSSASCQPPHDSGPRCRTFCVSPDCGSGHFATISCHLETLR